ncbi:hypothetical protein HU200_054265 [Digitaria exilis]|uniref:C2H2-type domain-containing protein n=1 Tax=Digitaria exilis TaxID=1010633 RepID=A0A835ALJ2_9POAL|nr:hypothetical protein HU200_054265 [Digitaria exilis]
MLSLRIELNHTGEEVKPGTTVSCQAGDGYVIHLSQAALGETKKGSENVVVYVKVDDKKLVLGTLSVERHPHIMCDLSFDDDFEISHNSKTTSVFLCGYKTPLPVSDTGDYDISSDEELETIPIKNDEIMKDLKNIKDDADEEMSSGDDDFSSDSDDSGMSVDDSSDEETSSGDELSDDSEDESDDSEEQTPTPKAAGKKRAIEAVTPSGKKAKVEPSGQKAGDKKGTPYPSKQDTKTPADKSVKTPETDKKSKEKSLKSGSHACKPCSKTFGSESALESHKKAKHGA